MCIREIRGSKIQRLDTQPCQSSVLQNQFPQFSNSVQPSSSPPCSPCLRLKHPHLAQNGRPEPIPPEGLDSLRGVSSTSWRPSVPNLSLGAPSTPQRQHRIYNPLPQNGRAEPIPQEGPDSVGPKYLPGAPSTPSANTPSPNPPRMPVLLPQFCNSVILSTSSVLSVVKKIPKLEIPSTRP